MQLNPSKHTETHYWIVSTLHRNIYLVYTYIALCLSLNFSFYFRFRCVDFRRCCFCFITIFTLTTREVYRANLRSVEPSHVARRLPRNYDAINIRAKFSLKMLPKFRMCRMLQSTVGRQKAAKRRLTWHCCSLPATIGSQPASG